MKTIIIGPGYPLRGGIANMNEALCRALNKEGISSKIFSFSLQYPAFLFPGTTQFDTGSPPPDIKVESFISSINPVTWFKAASRVKKEKPDLVIIRYWLPFMGPCLGTIARLIRRNKKIKVIAITDNVIPHDKKPGDRPFTRYFVKSCDGFIAMSKSVLNDLGQFTPTTKKRFSPHPVYNIFGEKVSKMDARKKLGLNPDDRYILFFGFVRKYKGLDLLLEAMGIDQVKRTGVKLIVAGEFYEDQSPYLEIIRKHKLEQHVILKPEYIHPEDVKYYFCAADMVTQTYRTATQSGVTQIAYHFERPMLVTDVGGLAEIVPDKKGGYVCGVNPYEIAVSIEDFYTQNREASFTECVRTEKKRFSWEHFVFVVKELYSTL